MLKQPKSKIKFLNQNSLFYFKNNRINFKAEASRKPRTTLHHNLIKAKWKLIRFKDKRNIKKAWVKVSHRVYLRIRLRNHHNGPSSYSPNDHRNLLSGACHCSNLSKKWVGSYDWLLRLKIRWKMLSNSRSVWANSCRNSRKYYVNPK